MMYAKVLSASAASGEAAALPTNPEPDVAESQSAMGTLFEILIYGQDRRNLAAAARQALREIAELDDQLSRWKPGTAISWINAHAAEKPVRVEPELFQLLLFSRKTWRETKGTFDITVAPLVQAWGFYENKPRLLDSDEISAALKIVGMQHLCFDREKMTVFFDRPAIEIDLGAIGKGFAVDRAVDILKTCRVSAALINSGASTIYAIGSPPGQDAWHVGVRDPHDENRAIATLALKDASLSTSGAPEKVFEIKGKRYSHILDPRTGFPAEGMVSATAIAPSATMTDALATAFYILGVNGTKEYCKAHDDVKAILIPEADTGEKHSVVVIGFDRKQN